MFHEQEINLPALYFAMQTKDIHMTKTVLGSNKDNYKYKNQLGETLLHLAVKNNFKELIKWLVQEGLDINIVDISNRTPLHLAITTKNENMIKYLLACNASTDLKDLYGKSPFHMAVQLGNTKLVELFLGYGANVLDATLTTYETAFHIALKNEDEKMFNLLLNNHFGHVNVPDEYGETLLHMLARKRKYDYLAKLLLEKGADLEILNKDNETALHFAIHNRNFNIATIFIEYGANVNVKNKYGESPLHLAIRHRDLQLVNLLLMNNADINEYTNDSNTMLHIAINYYNQDIVSLLLQHDVNVESRNSCDLSPFHLAIKNKCIDGAKRLLKKGVDVNSIAFGKFIGNHKGSDENQSFTPLHTAIAQKDIDAVKFLLENGAILDSNNNYDIFLAVETGSAEIVELLIQYGANVNALNISGESLLYTAMRIRNKEEVQTLLHYGANSENINERGSENETALHLAVRAKDEKFVHFLLEIGIDVNICNGNDSTALWFAHGNTNISNLLIMHIALMKVNNFFINRRNEIIIGMVEEFNSYYSTCLEELFKIKNKLCCNVSLLNFLTKDISVLVQFVRRKAVVYDFQITINDTEYPVYYKKLVENMEKAIERWNLIQEVENLLCTSNYFESLYDVLDQIVDNFSNDELKNFIGNSTNIENNEISFR